MAIVRRSFGGLHTDVDLNLLPSGAADIATNVTLEKGSLKKRDGFSEYEDSVGAGAIMEMFVAEFVDGDQYLIVKSADGKLYQRKLHPSAASSFSAITGGQTHNGADRGWFFMWADRLHYFDRAGGTRWHPDVNSGTAYKAGILRCTVGPLLSQAAGGEKEGYYRVVAAFRNNTTEEEGQFSGPVATSIYCALEDPDDKSGLAVTNWAAIDGLAAAANYEWDSVHFYGSMGNTEYIARGLGAQTFSHLYYDDAIVDTGAGSAGLNKSDHVRRRDQMATNTGGEPPGAIVGMFTGKRAIYGQVYVASTLVEEVIKFSINKFPTMVPAEYTYTQGGDSTTVEPLPWRGEVVSGFRSAAMCYGAGLACAFSATQSWLLDTYNDGSLYPRMVHPTIGCVAPGACVGTPYGVHTLGHRSWMIVTPQGTQHISKDMWTTTLEEIPAAQQEDAVMGYYGHRDQVWCAVTKSGATVAKRILVWDRSTGALDRDGRAMGSLVAYDLSGLSVYGITAMCEVSTPSQDPSMFVATSDGRILQYPSGTTDRGNSFTATWRGYFSQEDIAKDKEVVDLQVHAGDNVADVVTLTWKQLRTADQTVTAVTRPLTKDNDVEYIDCTLDRTKGHLFQVQFSDSGGAQWEIRDFAIVVRPAD